MTCSKGLMAIGRIRQSLLFKFDEPNSNQEVIKKPSFKKNLSRTKTSDYTPINTLNELLGKFQQHYPDIFEKNAKEQSGYLCIDESLVDWDSRIKVIFYRRG
jgi:hypothetical protein